jgi:glycosyltransferase involved in cell wall biosynthesis
MLLSVIIPTRNRVKRLADLLDSLAGQDPVPFEWEAIVVDNASTDDTAAVTGQKSQAFPIPIRYVLETRLGLHYGRHRGAREARGDYVGYLDDDMILAPTWVQGVQWLAEDRADAVVGRVLPKWETTPPDWLLTMIQDGVYAYLSLLDLGPISKPVNPLMVFGCNCFLPKRLIFELGGFHPDGFPPDLVRYRGDGETALMRKFEAAGLRAWYDPRATAYHIIGSERLTVEYLCERACKQGVSDSFAQIRAAHLEDQPYNDRRSLGYYVGRAKEMSLSELLQAVTGRFKHLIQYIISPAHIKIHKRIRAAYLEGWQFHQNVVRNDPELFKYVLRDNYLDED